MTEKKWKGVFVATVTPFKDDQIDAPAFSRILNRGLEAGLNGIVVSGTTGESPMLEEAEFAKAVEISLECAAGKVPVIAGTGSNSTKKSLERTILAKKLGAQGALVVTPYYVKPTPAGLLRHYSEVGRADLPMMVYNVPSRTAVNMQPETVERVIEEAPVWAVKECASLPQVTELIRRVGSKVSVMSGEDGALLPFLGTGGDGIVSVTANVIPESIVSVYRSFAEGKIGEAQKEFLRLAPLNRVMFIESNPIPAKTALAEMGFIQEEVRSPLAKMQPENRKKLLIELRELSLLHR